MSDQLQGVLLGALVTLLTVLLVHFREKAKQKSEETRWYGQFFLKRKFDALARLHEALVDCRFSLGTDPAVREGDPCAYLKNLQSKEFAAIRAWAVARIYLEEQQTEQVSGGILAFVHACSSISARVSEWRQKLTATGGAGFQWVTNDEWDKFMEGYKLATFCLRRLLSPQLPGSSPPLDDLDEIPAQPTS